MAPVVVDLSEPLFDGGPVLPGDPPVATARVRSLPRDACNLSSLALGVHAGTHVDAPLHLLEGGLPIDLVEPARLWGRARLLVVEGPPEDRPVGLAEALSRGFEPAPIVVVRTGVVPAAGQVPGVFPWPSPELLEWLLAEGLLSYMTDAPGVDPLSSASLPGHRLLLGRGAPIVENLRNLSELPEGEDFIVCALPLRLKGLEAAPCRAAAWLDR